MKTKSVPKCRMPRKESIRAVAQLPVQSLDHAASAGRSHAPDHEPRVQRRRLGRHDRHLPALYQGIRAALLRDGHQLYGARRAGLHHRADPRRMDGDLLDIVVLGFDLHLHLRDILPYGRRQPHDHQSVVQPRAVFGFDFAVVLTRRFRPD